MRLAAIGLLAAVSCVALAQSASDATWPVSDGHVVAGFGKHRGIDIAAAAGTPVQAFRAGVVVTVDTTKGCGQRLRLQHGDVMSIYCNLAGVQVKQGQQVAAGAELAKIAEPAPGGRAHLHFELQQAGEHVDPLTLLP